jgi:phenylpropionate dioxygenase-like ring-hydroxylating dioxygenase large terminal subunit
VIVSSRPSRELRGATSAVSPLTADLLAADSRPLETALRSTGEYRALGTRIPRSRYYDPAFAELEYERLWKKTWQYACREEDIPSVGDRIPYTVGHLSFMVVRSGPDRFDAFRNTCPHRGTRLCDGQGGGDTIRCPFHGWEWHLDGRLREVPSRWDFPHVKDEHYGLSRVRVDRWNGFVFINPDSGAPPLEDTLGVLPSHFADWVGTERVTAFHLRKLIRANWKIVLEAFLEAYHVIETHSNFMGFTGDANTQYDIWDDGRSHISRLITPNVVPSPHLGDSASVAEAANQAYEAMGAAMPGMPVPKFDPASPLSPRAQVAEWRRRTMGAGLGRDFSACSDAVMLDSIQYYMFPNFCPWWGDGLPLIYKFLPHGDDPGESLMEVRLTMPVPGGGAPRPPAAPAKYLGFDEGFHGAPEIGILSHIFDQDMGNLPRIQAAIRSAADDKPYITLGRYQEQRIQHFHEVLERVLGIGP